MNLYQNKTKYLILCSLVLLGQVFGKTLTVDLTNYNQWNLPFALDVEISSSEIISTIDGDHLTGTFTLLTDPNAYITVLFTEKDLSGTAQLNYTFYGEQELQLTGKWLDIRFNFYGYVDGESTLIDQTIRCFVAQNQTEQYNLSGNLGLAQAPSGFDDYNMLSKLSSNYSIGTNSYVIDQQFDENNLQYNASLTLSNDTSASSDSNLTMIGEINISDQLNWVSADTIEKGVTNPFLTYKLSVKFVDMNIENNKIYISNFKPDVFMTFSTQAVHLPYNMFEYFDNNFLQYLCIDESLYADYDVNDYTGYIDYQNCACLGDSFYGMPQLEFLTNTKNFDGQENQQYALGPDIFELLPKVNAYTRTTFCALAIWNLETSFPSQTASESVDTFALGQIFFKRYGLQMEYSTNSNGDLMVSIYTKSPSVQPSIVVQIIAFVICVALIIFLMIYLTIKKFKRLRMQADTYEKLRKLEKNYEIELNPEMFTEMQALKVEINMLKNHSNESAMATFNALKYNNQNKGSSSMHVKDNQRPVTFNLVKKNTQKEAHTSSMTPDASKKDLLSGMSSRMSRSKTSRIPRFDDQNDDDMDANSTNDNHVSQSAPQNNGLQPRNQAYSVRTDQLTGIMATNSMYPQQKSNLQRKVTKVPKSNTEDLTNSNRQQIAKDAGTQEEQETLLNQNDS